MAEKEREGPAPRSYSEFMRNLAAKYNGENPAEVAARAAAAASAPETDPRLAQPKPAGLPFPPAAASFPFPPFLFPPTSLPEGLKDGPFPFLPGLPRPPHLPPGLLEPAQAQALLSMMRAQAGPPAPRPPALAGPPAKRRRSSTQPSEEGPVSPPASRPPAARDSGCLSVCSASQACSAEGRAVLAWGPEEVAAWVRSLPACRDSADLLLGENIDGPVLALLTDSHLQAIGLKLGPALRLRAALAARLGSCPHCRHCRHCHGQE